MESDAAVMDSEEDLCELLWNDFQDILLSENKTKGKSKMLQRIFSMFCVRSKEK